MGTHYSSITGRIKIQNTAPTNPVVGDEYFDRAQLCYFIFNSDGRWYGSRYSSTSTSTTTSTSTSTSTSTTTTSTSSSTSTSTSTSTTTTG